MPAILERIKSRVRGRSRSRDSRGAADSRRSEEAVPATPTIPSQFLNQSRPSLENSAFHVTTARGVRRSVDDDPFQQRVAETNHSPTSLRQKNVDSSKKDERAAEIIPNRTSSRIVISNRPKSQPSAQTSTTVNGPASVSDGIGKRATDGTLAQERIRDGGATKSHVQLDTVEPTLAGNNEKEPATARESNLPLSITTKPQNTSSIKDATEVPSPTSPTVLTHSRRPSNAESTRRKPLPSTAEGKQSVLRKAVPTSQNGTTQLNKSDSSPTESQRTKEVVIAGSRLILPSHFNMSDTEETRVTEKQLPAVTHETIIEEKTEILQEEITRDIHYHHYYTYLQPIKVVEVLPPKHYFLNLETGERTEIPAPAGWSLPASMMPISPEHSFVKGWTRHYLVDEEHPTGILEAPPLKHEGDVNNLHQVAQEQRI